MRKKNYVDHDLIVKAKDNCLNKDIDWTWFFNEINELFDLKETCNLVEFDNQRRIISGDLIKLIIEITKIDNIIFNTENIFINDLINICRYFNTKIKSNDLVMHSSFGKMLFLTIYAAKKMNNNLLYEFSIFSTYNAYKYKCFDNLVSDSEYICDKIDELKFTDKDEIKSFFMDNINKINHDYDKSIIIKNTNRFINHNPFDFKGFSIENNTIYELELLHEILSIKLDKNKIIPAIDLNGMVFPDYKKWSNDYLLMLKDYFNCEEVDFIIDTLRYLQDMNMPHESLIQKHIDLLKDAFMSIDNKYLILCSTSFIFVSKMFKSKHFNQYNSINKKDLLMETGKISDEYIISEFKNNSFPIFDKQRLLLENSIKSGYERIDDIIDASDLLSYLINENNSKYITGEKFKSLKNKFREILLTIDDISIGTLFIEYMGFLLDLNNNENIKKDELNKEENDVARMWTNDYFRKVESMLHSYGSNIEIPIKTISWLNNVVLFNPKMIADRCMITSKEDILKQMIISSKYSVHLLVPKITIDEIFPYKRIISYKDDSLDGELESIVGELIESKGYKLLNLLEKDKYIEDIYNTMQSHVTIDVSLLTCENDIYKKIQELTAYKLTDIVDEINFSHLAGLFPILEMEIRKLCLYFDIYPIKEDKDCPVQYNDPSTLLKELINLSYNNVGTFEQFNDLYFIYNCMYNHNFLNIRNEFIHGRMYLDGFMFKYAFKITVLCLYMIILRNRHIEKIGSI